MTRSAITLFVLMGALALGTTTSRANNGLSVAGHVADSVRGSTLGVHSVGLEDATVIAHVKVTAIEEPDNPSADENDWSSKRYGWAVCEIVETLHGKFLPGKDGKYRINALDIADSGRSFSWVSHKFGVELTVVAGAYTNDPQLGIVYDSQYGWMPPGRSSGSLPYVRKNLKERIVRAKTRIERYSQVFPQAEPDVTEAFSTAEQDRDAGFDTLSDAAHVALPDVAFVTGKNYLLVGRTRRGILSDEEATPIRSRMIQAFAELTSAQVEAALPLLGHWPNEGDSIRGLLKMRRYEKVEDIADQLHSLANIGAFVPFFSMLYDLEIWVNSRIIIQALRTEGVCQDAAITLIESLAETGHAELATIRHNLGHMHAPDRSEQYPYDESFMRYYAKLLDDEKNDLATVLMPEPRDIYYRLETFIEKGEKLPKPVLESARKHWKLHLALLRRVDVMERVARAMTRFTIQPGGRVNPWELNSEMFRFYFQYIVGQLTHAWTEADEKVKLGTFEDFCELIRAKGGTPPTRPKSDDAEQESEDY